MTYYLHHTNRKTHRFRSLLCLFVLILCFGVTSLGYGIVDALNEESTTSETSAPKDILIYEIKQGKNTIPGEPVEFVTLYNPNDTNVSILDWTVEYAKPGFTGCTNASWFGDGTNPLVKRTVISGTGVAGDYATIISPHSLSAQLPLAMNDSAAGSVRLIDDTGIVQDLTGWQYNSSTGITINAPCSEDQQAASLSADKSLQRYLGCDVDEPVDTDHNSHDFFVSATTAGKRLGITRLPSCPVPAPAVPETASNSLTCAGAIINEILPNPAGTDTGHEFIELSNPTDDVIPLSSCALQYGDQGSTNTKTFAFPSDTELLPHSYRAFYDNETGISLTNSKAGTIWLLAMSDPANPVEISSATYPADLGDDISWMYDAGTAAWVSTYTPTPAAGNIVTATAPCPDSQVRNPDTNRCVTAANTPASTAAAKAATTLTPCAANQTRNPETNRCRNNATTAASSTPTPCKEGQERNPETNRCRAIASAAATAKACPAGQTRNPDTNRCRKVTAAGTGANSGINNVHDVASETKTGKNYWLIAIIALAGAITYGVYEWRHEIIMLVRKCLGIAGTEAASAKRAVLQNP